MQRGVGGFPRPSARVRGMIPAVLATLFQDQPAAGADVIQQLQWLGWVDRTAIAVLVVFFVIGLFKGLIWQVSRIVILVAAYGIAGRYGAAVGDLLARTPAVGGSAGPGPVDTPDTTLYLAYVLLFLAVLVVLSLLAMLVQKLAAKAGLGFFDRLGGGVVGVATGGCVVLFGLFVVHMFFRGSKLAEAAEASHSLRLSRRAIDWLGQTVPDDLRSVLALQPLSSPTPVDLQHGDRSPHVMLPDHGANESDATAPGSPGTAPGPATPSIGTVPDTELPGSPPPRSPMPSPAPVLPPHRPGG